MPVVVYGIQLADEELAALVKKVLNVSIIMVCLSAINTILRVVESPEASGQALVGLLISLLIPACGYVAAKNNDSSMACCFCGFNLFLTIMNILGIVALITLLGVVASACSSSDVNCQTGGTPEAMVIVSILLTCPMIILQCLGFWWGNQLYSRLQMPIIIQQPGVVMMQQQQQPGVMQPGMMQPGMVQPGMMQPGMVQPGMAQPGMMQPGMAQPGVV